MAKTVKQLGAQMQPLYAYNPGRKKHRRCLK